MRRSFWLICRKGEACGLRPGSPILGGLLPLTVRPHPGSSPVPESYCSRGCGLDRVSSSKALVLEAWTQCGGVDVMAPLRGGVQWEVIGRLWVSVLMSGLMLS